MRLSQNFTRTSRDVPSDEVAINAQLLIRGGYVFKTMAGVYSWLPLGLRVLNKVENIVRKHMNSIGGQEVLMNNLQPKSWWETSGNWDNEINDVLFHVPSYNLKGTEYALSTSNEENVTAIAKQYINSYKDLPDYNERAYPLSIYHINTKFRDEKRSKSGIMRGREFRMKDMYDFHKNSESQARYFEVITQAYVSCFQEIGLEAKVVNASGGAFSSKFSREFQVLCEAGEDRLYLVPGTDLVYNEEVAPVKVEEFIALDSLEELTEHDLPGVIGVENLHAVLGIPIIQCTKTIFFADTNEHLVVAVVRADREISIEKLTAIHQSKLVLANTSQVHEFTGAEVGYAGLYNLPKNEKVHVYVDDSCENLVNFECGGNKTGIHVANVNWERDILKPELFYDIKSATEGDIHPLSGEIYEVCKGAEVGNIFDLGTRWTKAFNVQYTDLNNTLQYPLMGCHGFGITRTIGVVAELYSDRKGLIWPESISPYHYHLISHAGKQDAPDLIKQIYDMSKEFYDSRPDLVLWDDRGVGMGEKLGDSELIGCPITIIISSKNITSNTIELRYRASGEVKYITIEQLGRLSKSNA